MARTATVPRRCAALLAAAALPALGWAQAPGSGRELPPAAAFAERLEVVLVDLEVVVTDAEGHPVAGLTADEFALTEDGRPVALTHFQAVAPSPQPAAHGPGGESATPRPPKVLGIFVGDLAGPSRTQAFAALREALPRELGPGDQAIVFRAERGLVVEQRLTGDPALAAEALGRLERSVAGVAFAAERRQIAQQILAGEEFAGDPADAFAADERDPRPDLAAELLRRVRAFADQAAARVDRSVAALGAAIDSLATLPGRRVLVVLAGDLEPRPGEELFELWDDKYGASLGSTVGASSPFVESRRYDRAPALAALVDRAVAGKVAVYGLADASPTDRLSTAEMGVRAGGGPSLSVATDPLEGLADVARATGGRAIAGAQRADQLVAGLASDLETYYSIGFHREASPAGEEHRLSVEVRRPGLKVRHRTVYRAKSVAETSADRVLAALLHDRTDNPFGLRVEVGTATRENRDRFLVPLIVRIPLGKLLLVPDGDSHRASLSVVVAVQDAEGRLSEPRRHGIPVTIPNARLLDALVQDLGYQVQLELRGGEHKLGVAVVDELSGVTSTLNLTLPANDG